MLDFGDYWLAAVEVKCSIHRVHIVALEYRISQCADCAEMVTQFLGILLQYPIMNGRFIFLSWYH